MKIETKIIFLSLRMWVLTYLAMLFAKLFFERMCEGFVIIPNFYVYGMLIIYSLIGICGGVWYSVCIENLDISSHKKAKAKGIGGK